MYMMNSDFLTWFLVVFKPIFLKIDYKSHNNWKSDFFSLPQRLCAYLMKASNSSLLSTLLCLRSKRSNKSSAVLVISSC